jgi:hypothetical protein
MAVRVTGAGHVTLDAGQHSSGQNNSGLQRLPAARVTRLEPTRNLPNTNGAFFKYRRSLTPEGGVLINYRDADRRWRFKILRAGLWIAMTGVAAWLIHSYSPLNFILDAGSYVGTAFICWRIVRRPVEAFRSIEIRPDGMIIDGTDVFWLSLIEDNWPVFQPRDEDPDDQGLCGIYGTRLVEYATVYRFDKNDRTPETLATHVHDAMMKLWGEPGAGPDRAGPATALRRRR